MHAKSNFTKQDLKKKIDECMKYENKELAEKVEFPETALCDKNSGSITKGE